ncbi:MAG: thiamine pyrophosphate-binding protein [Hyphomicrobiales bacterium]|nr:thiamine pyrophosphate-binding protein [Hyphomicrobiales bacterium]
MNIPAPSSQTKLRSGGQILLAALRIHGTDTVFGIPGEGALPIFDALLDEQLHVRFVTCRHEANASHMAEADAKLTGRPGVCMVSRGPGAMHAAIGVHTAWQDSTPMLMIVGQVPRHHIGREAFQEMNFERVFADMTKWSVQIEDPRSIPELVSRAFHIATHGRPGPVMLSVPEDVLSTKCDVPDAAPYRRIASSPSASEMAEVHRLLQSARKPVVIVGGGGWTDRDAESFAAFVAQNDLPVVAGFRSQDILDNASEQYIGDMSLGGSRPLAARIAESDVILAVGDRLGEVTTRAYTTIDCPNPKQALIHVHPGAEELGRVYNATLPIQSSVGSFVDALSQLPRLAFSGWKGWRTEGRQAYLDYSTPTAKAGSFDLAQVILHLRERLPDDAIVANGAGNCNIWLHRFFQYRRLGTQIAPRSGAMGYGFAGAIAAKLRHPDKIVVGFAGDGCFTMSSPEMATAARYELPLVIIVVNNGMYGSIRMHQERHYPGRPSATLLTNPDFSAFARSFGAHGETVDDDRDFPAAFERALAFGKPALIELRVDPRQLTPDLAI